MSGRVLVVAALVLSSSACIATEYRPRTVQAGVPSLPPTRLESVTTGDQAMAPGIGRTGIAGGPFVQPAVTREGWENGDEVENSHVRGVSVGVRLQTGEPTEIAGMSWTTPESPLCSSGRPALRISVDGSVRWERPLVIAGEHVVTGRFDEDGKLLQQPSVVDLRLVDQNRGRRETCVRIPATGPGVAFSASMRGLSGVGFRGGGRSRSPARAPSRSGLALLRF